MLAVKRLLALSAVLAAPAWAVPPATVTAVQAPAWLERNGHTKPLAVGMAIENGDRIRTGEDARAFLGMAEGSTVKLGENSRLALFSMSAKPKTHYKGALDVVDGTFRFTTDAKKRVKSREVMIRVGTATAGVRGTDVWGRSNDKEDLICLIEGKIDVWHAALPGSVAMTEPMTYFLAPKGETPKPVEAVTAEELQRWAQKTEITPGQGATRKGGKWKVLLGRYASETDALMQYDIVRGAGYGMRIKPIPGATGGWTYEVTVPGFPDEGEAKAAAARLSAATGIAAVTAR
jgi:hypothetical protein